MARDRRLPRGLASVSKKYGTPTGAIVLMIVVMAGFIALNEFWEDLFALPELPHYFSIFVWASTFGGFALVVVYLLMSVGAFRGLSDHGSMAGVYIASIVGIALTAAAIFGAFYKQTSPTVLAPWFALGWLVIGAIVTMVMGGRAPASEVLGDLHSEDVGAS